MTVFAMFRIIGNALPPRHSRSDNVRAVEYILKNEPRFGDCQRIWILNRILNPVEKAAILQPIKSAGEEVIDLPFDAAAHYRAFLDVTGLPLERRLFGDVGKVNRNRPLELEWIIRHKSQTLVGINSARNHALKLGRERADWTLVLDGGVVFTPEGWSAFVSGLRSRVNEKFAVIDLRRTFDWHAVEPSRNDDGVEEPQIAFHRSSTDLFDERLRYGNRNKVELLKRIGVDGPWLAWRSARWDVDVPIASPDKGAFLRAGFVVRLPAGEENGESAVTRLRFVNRFLGVAQRSAEVDLLFARSCRNAEREFTVGIPPAGKAFSSSPLESQVGTWLAESDRFVTGKQAPPHLRLDPHDYYSAAPYWSADGQRYDGIVQDERSPDDPQSGHFDRASMLRFVRKVYGLTLAGRLLGRRDLFERPAALLRAWFLDPATRMNPTMRHAQVIPGNTDTNDVGIIEFREYCYLPYAICLLEREGVLSPEDADGIRKWFATFLEDCESAGITSSALDRRNNIATWAAAVFGTMALFVNRFSMAFAIVRTSPLRLGAQLGALSLQPHETERTRPLHYSLFNLSGWWSMMRLGQEFGIDLDGFAGSGGESLRQAVSFCADNRRRFGDYQDNGADFDVWLDLLGTLFSPVSHRSGLHMVTNAYWGLPPVIVAGRA